MHGFMEKLVFYKKLLWSIIRMYRSIISRSCNIETMKVRDFLPQNVTPKPALWHLGGIDDA